jgi:prevent-host-death family protein
MDWRLAEAKNKFSELFNRALAEGPQRVRRRNEVVVVIAASDYEQLTGSKPGFKDFLMAPGPDLEGLDLSRNRKPMREIDL